MNPEFILLSEQNISLFHKIFTSCIPEWQGYNEDLIRFKTYIKCLNINNNTSFIYQENNKQIGFFLGAVAGHRAYILAIGVLNDFRSKGYGSILLQTSRNYAQHKQRGIP